MGSFIRQICAAFGHLGLKAHPSGGFNGEGNSPVSIIRFLRKLGSVVGVADRSASVYGCEGASKIVAAGPASTTLPRYITITSLEMWRTTDKSWLMKI